MRLVTKKRENVEICECRLTINNGCYKLKFVYVSQSVFSDLAFIFVINVCPKLYCIMYFCIILYVQLFFTAVLPPKDFIIDENQPLWQKYSFLTKFNKIAHFELHNGCLFIILP